jgi:hypothetical protein
VYQKKHSREDYEEEARYEEPKGYHKKDYKKSQYDFKHHEKEDHDLPEVLYKAIHQERNYEKEIQEIT